MRKTFIEFKNPNNKTQAATPAQAKPAAVAVQAKPATVKNQVAQTAAPKVELSQDKENKAIKVVAEEKLEENTSIKKLEIVIHLS